MSRSTAREPAVIRRAYAAQVLAEAGARSGPVERAFAAGPREASGRPRRRHADEARALGDALARLREERPCALERRFVGHDVAGFAAVAEQHAADRHLEV